MPGTLVRDANASNILTGATLTAAGTTNSTAVQVDRPAHVRATLTLATVTGTSPTISITLQGSDDNTFATGVVSYGTFGAAPGTVGAKRYLQARIYHKYVRAVVTLGGTTPSYASSTLYLEQPDFNRVNATDTAT